MATAKKVAVTKPAAAKADAKPVIAAATTAAAKPEKAKKEPKPAKIKDAKNGIPRPSADTTCGKVWAIADKLTKGDKVAKRKDVLEATTKAEIDASTAATQFGRWRRYNGITGREAAE